MGRSSLVVSSTPAATAPVGLLLQSATNRPRRHRYNPAALRGGTSRPHGTDDETALLVQRPPTSQPGNGLRPPAPYPPPRLHPNADAPLGAEHMPRQLLPTPWSYPDGSHAGTVFLVDRHRRLRPLVNPPLPSLSGAQDLATHHSLADPLPPFT